MKKNTMFVMVLFFFLALAGNTVMGQQRGGCFTTMNRPAPCGGSHFSNPCGGCGISHTGPCGGVGGVILQQLLCGSCHGPQHSGPCGGGNVGFNAWGGGAPVLVPTLNLSITKTVVSNVPAPAYQNQQTADNGRVIPSRQAASSAQGGEDDYDNAVARNSNNYQNESGLVPLTDNLTQFLVKNSMLGEVQFYVDRQVILRDRAKELHANKRGELVASFEDLVFGTNLHGIATGKSASSDHLPSIIQVTFDEKRGMFLNFQRRTDGTYALPDEGYEIDKKVFLIASGHNAQLMVKMTNETAERYARGETVR